MYRILRNLLFQLDPERAHGLTLQLLSIISRTKPALNLLHGLYSCSDHPVELFGLKFKNPIGLAAGYDKDGMAVPGLAALGFGHIEVGTVTPLPQLGNPKPRVFRLVEDQAIINRMGFPGRGAKFVADQLKKNKSPKDVIIGVNLGKNKDTPLENSAEDYLSLIHTFAPLADYLTINISSPNTVGLRRLQSKQMLKELLEAISLERKTLAHKVPVLVKLAPDLSEEELDDALEVILETGMDGIVATNTTLERPGLRSKWSIESGGLSGAPLRMLSLAMLDQIVRKVDGKIPVISSGGVMTSAGAKDRFLAGASLVQIYTGLVYTGPGLVKDILNNL